jgi:hypothetical protein
MNVFFDCCRPAGWRPGAGVLCLLCILAAGAGCGKSENTAPPVVSATTTNVVLSQALTTTAPAPVPSPVQAEPSAPPTTANAGLTQLQILNRAMLGWEIKNHRHPQTFEEFASSANIQIPAPPAGQKYALNGRGFIVLVNSTQ